MILKQCCRITSVVFIISLVTIILASLIFLTYKNNADHVLAQNATNMSGNTVREVLSNQTAQEEPNISVDALCQIAQLDIPGEFNASGFTPNIHVGIIIDKNSSISTSSIEPVSMSHNDYTDGLGKINGTFIIHSNIDNYREYFLHIFNDDDKDNLPDSQVDRASVSLNLC
jgi:hypothetical protein